MPIFASLVVVDEARRNHLIRGSPVDVSYLERLITRGVLQLREPAPELVLAVARVIEFKDAPIVAAAITAEASMFASYDRKHLLSRADDIRRLFDIAVMTPEKIVRSMPSTD